MRNVDDRLELSASDLANHLGCRHLTQLDLAVANGRLAPPEWRDPDAGSAAGARAGARAAYLDHLRAEGLSDRGAGPGRRRGGARAHHRGDAGRCRRHLSGDAQERSLAWPRRFPAARRAAEPARSLVLRGAGRQARPRHPRRHHPAALPLLAPGRRDPGRPARAHARRHAGRGLRSPEPSAFTTFWPTTGWCSAGSRRRSAAPAHCHLSGPRAALRHLPLVAGLRPPAPRRRPPLPRRRDLEAADQRAPQLGRRHADGARRAAAAARTPAVARRAGDL